MSKRPADSNFVIRFFFIHCFLLIYQVLVAKDPTTCFTPPRFELFSQIKKKYKKGKNTLFNNLVYTFRKHIIQGAIITIIFVSFNLVVPALIRVFMEFMHSNHEEQMQFQKTKKFIKILSGVQILRVLFGEHTRRTFRELAIKIESALARQLIIKSLNLAQKARKDISHSQILQLQNVDLKLIYNMFSNFYFLFQAPLTIIVALLMLFMENTAYGFIGAYWFLIAFLLHRQLDQKMTHCNQTKLGLIQKRSKINYETISEIRQAKIIGWEDIIIEKNNDLFEQQNHDHYLFYFYNSLYDIIVLMLPVLVVVTITIWDYNEPQPITVEQVYMMLFLLGICYTPMKEFRTISISFNDGLRSLSRIQQYLDLPNQLKCEKITDDVEPGNLIIKKGTSAHYQGDIFDFFLACDKHIEVGPGERIIILGRKNHGKTSFLKMISGLMSIIQGSIKINGKIAYLSDNLFFIKSTVRNNIAFYNSNASQQQIQYVFQELGLSQQLKKVGGLDGVMEDMNIYTRSQIQRISIARVLCSKANIYILDCPFEEIDKEDENIVEALLRNKQQKQGVLIISTFNHLDFLLPNDKIIVLEKGKVKQFGKYQQLQQNQESSINKFFTSRQCKEDCFNSSQRSQQLSVRAGHKMRKIINIFKSFQYKQMGFDRTPETKSTLVPPQTVFPMKFFLDNLIQKRIKEIQKERKQQKRINLTPYIRKFIFAAPISQILFILLIIACAELLHVFIHFYIGHLEEEHGENSYLKFQNMVGIEVILTFCLAGILYYQGDVSSKIAIIQGNNLYKQAITELTKKRIHWFTHQYCVRIADRFNHDYEEIFIACHSLLGIYKNLIILITTVFFISSNGTMAIVIFGIISFIYISIYVLFRKVERLIVRHYYDYKYSFVKAFEECLEGADYFNIFDSTQQILKMAQLKYRKLVSYKLAQNYGSHALSILCDITSNFLLAVIISYGLEGKIHSLRFHIAMIATSIHLLMNGSEVLKSIVKETINFQTFFLLNIIPFSQIDIKDQKKQKIYPQLKKVQKPNKFEVKFDNIILKEAGDVSADVKFNLTIPQGQVIAIMETMDDFRNLFLYALTQNIGMIKDPAYHESVGKILIGGTDIRTIDPQYRRQFFGIIMAKNFSLSGTLKDNLMRKIRVDEEKVHHYIKLLKIDDDIEDYDRLGLDAPIYFQNSKINYQLTKKFAIARTLIKQSKIIIIKDTSIYIDSISIIKLLKKNIPNCTIIILSNKIECVIEAERIVNMDNYVIVQDGTPEELAKSSRSQIGHLLRDTNIQGYLYMNRVSGVFKKNKQKVKAHKKAQMNEDSLQFIIDRNN